MRASVTKCFTFDAAHKIPNHAGKCRDLHGHTYKLEVTIHGNIQTRDPTASEYGMVCDFDLIKRIFKSHIEPLVDHKYLNDTLPCAVTTAENIAVWCYGIYKTNGVTPSKVRIWETGSSYAEVRNGDVI